LFLRLQKQLALAACFLVHLTPGNGTAQKQKKQAKSEDAKHVAEARDRVGARQGALGKNPE